MARRKQAGFGFGRARRARHRSDGGGEPDEIQPLPLERFARMAEPILCGAPGATLKRDFDQPGIAAVETAQQMHGIGKVASRMRSCRLQQRGEVRMARAPVARDAYEMRLGNADRLALNGPVDRHSVPSLARAEPKPIRTGPKARA